MVSVFVFLVPAVLQISAQFVFARVVLRFVEFSAGNLFGQKFLVYEIMFEIVGLLVAFVLAEFLHPFGWCVADVERHGQVAGLLDEGIGVVDGHVGGIALGRAG